eukprot:TRINITY_DN2311_c0_g2_i2.p1 TRINITY_DN2311_c0_g2~~TRINITY_DN2311_c0_g2_i2.p1  ORF type:complete len:1254 (+),score=406.06 TRINITY_DN2311_c0_g2_i2:197-3958(+)
MIAPKAPSFASRSLILCTLLLALSFCAVGVVAQGSDEFVSCGGFIKPSSAIQKALKGSKLDVADLKVELLSKDGSSLRGEGVVTPSGYWVIPVYDSGSYQIRVRSPVGWTFAPSEAPIEVASGKCNGDKDVNFELTGFTVSGQVASDKSCSKGAAAAAGVAGVSVTLSDSEGKAVATAVSQQGGAFVFDNIAPGSYKVAARGDAASQAVAVQWGPSKVAEPITISKFEITGAVGEGGDLDAVAGVDVILFGDKKLTSCASSATSSPELPANFKTPAAVDALKVLCVTKSDKSGQFKFSNVACGTYTVVPFYRTAGGSVYDVSPASAKVDVAGANAVVSERFRVRGFSVGGRVVVPGAASGVAGVTVRLGDLSTTTDASGVYKFEQVEAGQYKISASKDKMTFSGPSAIQITPSTSKLPEFTLKTVELCGRVSIPHPPAGVEPTTTSSRQVALALASNPSKTISKTSTSVEGVSGSYCFSVEPAQNYVVSPVVTDREERAGLLLSSTAQTVKVDCEPVANVNFAQSLLTVSGRVRCLTPPCDPSIAVTLQSSGSESGGDVVTTGLVADDVFVFQHVVPGSYVVSIDKPDWCFENQALQVQVIKQDVSDLELVQSGYKLNVKSSHDVNVEYGLVGEKTTNSLAVKARGESSSACVAAAGVYNVRVAQSCFSFSASNAKTVSENNFQYSTESNGGKPISLTAKSYRLNGVVELHAKADDVTVEIRSSKDKSLVAVAPLKQVGTPSDGITRFAYNHWVDLAAGGSDAVEVVPVSKHVFFYPKSIKSAGSAADCPPTLPTISGRPGVFVQGQVEPATAGVKITVTGGDDAVETESDASGKYRVGPLPDNAEYSVSATAPGFYLKKEAQESSNKQVFVYNFRAMKLGSALVSIVGQDGAALALPGVLISLSGGEGYRNNTVTGADGTLRFANLFPGDYFVIPMLKEYTFAPAGGQAVTVEEGVEKKVEFRATRVAFSVFGSVRSLNGASERAVVVEAVSDDGSAVVQREEATTDETGSFRLRGLAPGRKYSVGFKSGVTSNERIDSSVPTRASVTVSAKSPADVTDVNFVVYRRPTRQNIGGRIVLVNSSSGAEFEGDVRSSLTIQLIDSDATGTVVKETKLTRDLEVFDFASLTPSKSNKWILRIKSTLNPTLYSYKFEDVKFEATGASTFVDVPLTVTVKQPGEEAPPSSVANLVFMILLGLFVFYRKEATTYVWKTLLKKEGEFAFGDTVETMLGNLKRRLQSRKVVTTSTNASKK